VDIEILEEYAAFLFRVEALGPVFFDFYFIPVNPTE
jgi:hypothetical protein